MGALLLAGCGAAGDAPPARPTAPAGESLGDRAGDALRKAGRYLISRQSPDGAWRSEQYGAFKDGYALTPTVVVALQQIPDLPNRDAVCQKALDFLSRPVRADGSIDEGPHGLSYPVYTAAGAVVALSRLADEGHRRARDAWLKYLRERQLTEALGWQPADKEYGGWGYCVGMPRKPAGGQPVPPLTESNLSATVFALEALATAGVRTDDPAFQKALVFVQRCQNYGDNGPSVDRGLNDGGFFFIYDDPVRNKAGVAGKDSTGSVRFRSYGSTTADGLRSLLLCGLPAEDTRVDAARFWFSQHFRPDGHPGSYAKGREVNQNAVYFYYCCSAAKCIRPLRRADSPPPGGGARRWFPGGEGLPRALLHRQRPDGSWANEAVAQREDDPLVATPFAVEALAAFGGAQRRR